MASKSKKEPLAALMSLPGVGKATAKKLSDAGIKSAAGIKKAGKKGLTKAGLTANMSEKLLNTVNKGQVVKTAVKKSAAKAKNAAKGLDSSRESIKSIVSCVNLSVKYSPSGPSSNFGFLYGL